DKALVSKGLGAAGLAALAVVALWLVMVFAPGTPLIDEAACITETGAAVPGCSIHAELRPLYQSLVGGFFLLFLLTGWAYGRATGTIKDHRDLVAMMAESMKDMGYYLVLAFAAAHFVAMFNWSNLGLITAVHGADAIESTGLPLPIVLGLMVLFSGLLNLFVGSASAKWALLAPILVPMLMLLGISPEGATAAYRVGDSATNIITPLMVYFPLILVFAQRWQPNFGLGSLTAMMLPYSVWLLISGTVLIVIWFYLGIPLGPDAPVGYELANAGG
ncbi:MAG: AbgT family transporter, partial [Pseudomonadota bacterium]